MKLIRNLYNLPKPTLNCVATIGNFDGVHCGHQALINKIIAMAKHLQLPSLVISFEPQPNEYFSQGNAPARLMRLRDKYLALNHLGIDYLLCLRFNKKLAELSAEDFVKEVLVKHLRVHYILVGDDFRFGSKRSGTIELLQTLGECYNFIAEQMTSYSIEGHRVSSTGIRRALAVGDLSTAKLMLGRPYGMSGHVAHGDKRGRIIGFPTANIFLHRKSVPVSGVFAVKVYGCNHAPVNGVANVGTRPTVDGTRSLLEVHLFDFNKDIYGQPIYVEFLHKLRDEKRFESFELLKQQIFKDVENAKKIFADAACGIK